MIEVITGIIVITTIVAVGLMALGKLASFLL